MEKQKIGKKEVIVFYISFFLTFWSIEGFSEREVEFQSRWDCSGGCMESTFYQPENISVLSEMQEVLRGQQMSREHSSSRNEFLLREDYERAYRKYLEGPKTKQMLVDTFINELGCWRAALALVSLTVWQEVRNSRGPGTVENAGELLGVLSVIDHRSLRPLRAEAYKSRLENSNFCRNDPRALALIQVVMAKAQFNVWDDGRPTNTEILERAISENQTNDPSFERAFSMTSQYLNRVFDGEPLGRMAEKSTLHFVSTGKLFNPVCVEKKTGDPNSWYCDVDPKNKNTRIASPRVRIGNEVVELNAHTFYNGVGW